jgi:mannose/cellobiose epimerase-like protein (N-acyl-D-glucosamine 2-epimerase family)
MPTGLDLKAMAAEYRHQLFDEYLPFWENGGYDEERGGFMCYLHDDGSVQDDRKDIWYQGRGVWVYAFLYNNIDRNPKWLEMAMRSRDFMVRHMHRGDGTWIDTVNRFGEPVDGIDPTRDGNIYGALFSAVGLIQHAKATGSEEDLELAKKTLRRSMERYDNPAYVGVAAPSGSGVERERGLRAQGHSFMFAWVVPQLLELDDDPYFASLARQHLGLIADRFWNADYGISNETLLHDYTRIPTLADHMVPGHSIETQWMAMAAAAQLGDEERVALFRDRLRRLIEMSWDHVFGGIGDTDYRVFGNTPGANGLVGADFSIKAMWAQTEVVIGTLRVFADTGESWALDWYERSWEYVQRTMRTDIGVWRQAVDRFGEGMHRPGISRYRKGNFHQPRCLMMNLLQLERMIASADE